MKTNRPSRTALKIAVGLMTLSVRPGMNSVLPPGVASATGKLLLATGLANPVTLRLAKTRLSNAIYDGFDWMMPGQFEAIAHRKAFCEDQVRQSVQSGATQVLVLGAGYDTLCWRLAPEFPDVRFFEIDHPATARVKARGIRVMGEKDNLLLLAKDLGRHPLAEVLRDETAWDSDARTIIVAEGLVMYLTPKAVHDLFQQCAAVTGPASQLAFSYIPSGADGRPDTGSCTGLVLWMQRRIGEPWNWSIEPENLGSFLLETGWKPDLNPATQIERQGIEYFVAASKPA